MKDTIRIPLPPSRWILLIAIFGVVGGRLSVQAEIVGTAKQKNVPAHVESFLQASCIDCHDGPEGEAGFDIRRARAATYHSAPRGRW